MVDNNITIIVITYIIIVNITNKIVNVHYYYDCYITIMIINIS